MAQRVVDVLQTDDVEDRQALSPPLTQALRRATTGLRQVPQTGQRVTQGGVKQPLPLESAVETSSDQRAGCGEKPLIAVVEGTHAAEPVLHSKIGSLPAVVERDDGRDHAVPSPSPPARCGSLRHPVRDWRVHC